MNEYQLLIIGAGPGGYVAAIRAAQLGIKTAIVERENLGGTCLNRGCIPTKAILHTTSAYAECAHFKEIGLSVSGLTYDMEKIHERKNEVVETLVNGVSQLLKANGVDIIKGTATIISPNKVMVDDLEYKADGIIIATGSFPSRPPIPGIELENVVTSDEILQGPVKDYKSLVIIGGGVVGVEMASIYSNLGCKVTIIEAMDRIIPTMDREIAQNLTMVLKKSGVEIIRSATVENIAKDGVELTCSYTYKGSTQTVTAQGVLISIGRRPNTADLFGSDISLEMERGFIKVDNQFKSSIDNIYAIGDVIGGIQLAHKAEAEGMAAVEMMFGHKPAIETSLVPSCIYTNPEIASVGITLDDAKKKGISVKSGKYLMGGNGKSIIDMQERGFIRVIFDEETDKLLGVQMICAHATDLISEFTSAILNESTRSQLLMGIRPHPSFAEGITEALEAVGGMSIHSAPVRR